MYLLFLYESVSEKVCAMFLHRLFNIFCFYRTQLKRLLYLISLFRITSGVKIGTNTILNSKLNTTSKLTFAMLEKMSTTLFFDSELYIIYMSSYK